MWPSHARELCRGVNDTWNSYQRANKGRTVTTAEWKSARSSLWNEHEQLSSVEVSSDEGFLDSGDEPSLYSPGMKREYQAAAVAPPDLLSSFSDPFDEPDHFAKRQRIPGDWVDGDYAYDAFDEYDMDNCVMVAPDDFC